MTSHGVGMSVPDWPNTYGYNMFFFPFSKWVGGIFYEHSHRLLASAVGMLTSILALWLHGRAARPFMRWTGALLCAAALATFVMKPARADDAAVLGLTGLALLASSFLWPRCEPQAVWLRRLGLCAFFAVVLQGVLGGLRVTEHKDALGIFHATLAQLFFVLVCAIALFTSGWWRDRWSKPLGFGHGVPPGAALFAATTATILLQLILGATMRHQHAGLSIPDFPLAYGKIWPALDPQSVANYNRHRLEVTDANAITAVQIVLQMVHRLCAAAILVLVALCAWRSRQADVFFRRATLGWLGLIVLQVLLGAATIWSNKAADIATAHVLVGALSLATGAIVCIVAFRMLQLNPVGAPVSSGKPAAAGLCPGAAHSTLAGHPKIG